MSFRARVPSSAWDYNIVQNTINPMASEQNYNAAQADIERQFQADQAQLNRDFQERMSNSALERTLTQAKNVGINPYAMMNGSMMMASTPSGASPGGTSGARSGGHGSALPALINSALSFVASGLHNKALRNATMLKAASAYDVANITHPRASSRRFYDSDGVFRGGFDDYRW